MKDGIADKLQDYIVDLNKEGIVCMIVGAEYEALDQIECCDLCKIKYLQAMCNQAAWDLLAKYKKAKRDASSH